MISIDLKVPPYLKSYLTTLYGDEYHLGTADSLGILVLNTLKKKSCYYKHSIDDNRTSVYKLHISLSMFEKYGCGISEEQLTQICKAVDNEFRRAVYTHAILSKSFQGFEYKDSILSFLYAYNISEEELSYSTIRRDFNRKKTKITERLTLTGHN